MKNAGQPEESTKGHFPQRRMTLWEVFDSRCPQTCVFGPQKGRQHGAHFQRVVDKNPTGFWAGGFLCKHQEKRSRAPAAFFASPRFADVCSTTEN
jgi:hypothetical protein